MLLCFPFTLIRNNFWLTLACITALMVSSSFDKMNENKNRMAPIWCVIPLLLLLWPGSVITIISVGWRDGLVMKIWGTSLLTLGYVAHRTDDRL